MNLQDIQRLQADGFLAADQRDRIIAHYKLQDGQSKFVVILSIIGALLVASGIILLISANWDAIPRGVKLLSGLALMLGAHAAGWWTRRRHADYHKTAEALHPLPRQPRTHRAGLSPELPAAERHPRLVGRHRAAGVAAALQAAIRPHIECGDALARHGVSA